MLVCYRIADWERFEDPQVARRGKLCAKALRWPADLYDRERWALLDLGDEGFRAFAVFVRLLELHAQQNIENRDGFLFAPNGGPASVAYLAGELAIRPKIVADAIVTLSRQSPPWLTLEQFDDEGIAVVMGDDFDEEAIKAIRADADTIEKLERQTRKQLDYSEAGADLWDRLSGGRLWGGLVKLHQRAAQSKRRQARAARNRRAWREGTYHRPRG